MFKTSRTAMFLVAAATLAFPASSFATHSWGGYHWARQSNPFTLKLGNNTTNSDWSGHLSQTSRDWNALNSPVRTTIVSGTSNKRCSMVVGTTQVCNGRYGNNGWLGLASINITGGTHITQGSAKMNDSYFDSATYNNPNEREHVMCQEVAHTFGLAHQSEDGSSQNSCMDYFSNTGANAGSTVSTKPNSHDTQELNSIYSHLDSTTTVASFQDVMDAKIASMSSPVHVGDDLTEPWQFGTPIDFDHAGRANTFKLEKADGDIIITHVLWVDDEETDGRTPGQRQRD